MTKLTWGNTGDRTFETGVDRGVLYVESAGVAWNGLVAVKEAPSGGTPEPFFYDGFKYLQLASSEEFTATLDAFSAPSQFAECDGSSQMSNGLFATQQPRKQFNLSYRTKVGNDTDGIDHGYKIHVVYNALAAPSQQNNSTLSNSTTPVVFSWAISTAPIKLTNTKPTSHFVIDSRYTSPALLAEVEAILYGTSSTIPRLITAEDLARMFGLTIVDLGSGRYRATGFAVRETVPGVAFTINHDTVKLTATPGHFTIDY